jgi:hypothetical protein
LVSPPWSGGSCNGRLVLAGERRVLDDFAGQVDPGARDDCRPDVRPPRRAGQGAPRLARPPPLPARALAQVAQAALHRRLDRRDDDRQFRVTAAVAVQRVRGELGNLTPAVHEAAHYLATEPPYERSRFSEGFGRRITRSGTTRAGHSSGPQPHAGDPGWQMVLP